ncbi:hypothetical protein B484DRAFT_448287 [Ochromonadaceae sp. CCMP2298]|nr:hypothetical protein B484DRAFT_448287 [Ochromonadaceae sp. CCMP2298]|mmetsp:Transcript_14923/g.32958  ORF Transcript_14923/g.32958 Transcript_14923/m.32958 type:complete len:243 (+) Transcript_14923:185-913(+)
MQSRLLLVCAAIFLLCLSSSLALVATLRGATSIRLGPIERLRALHLAADDDDRPKLQMAEEIDGPRVKVRTLEESAPVNLLINPKIIAPVVTVTPPALEKKKSSKTFGNLSMDELVAAREERIKKRGGALNQKTDINGIEPATPFLFSTVAVLMSYAAWQASTYMAGHFAISYLDSEYYPVQRIAMVGRNVVVGMFMLFSGFSGSIAFGLVLLGGAVAIGVAKGELDPKKVKEEPEKEIWPF